MKVIHGSKLFFGTGNPVPEHIGTYRVWQSPKEWVMCTDGVNTYFVQDGGDVWILLRRGKVLPGYPHEGEQCVMLNEKPLVYPKL